jgi:hypothetical protein
MAAMIVNIRFLWYYCRMDTRKLFGKRDVLFIFGALCLAAAFWLHALRDMAPTCRVSYGGEAVLTMPLDVDATFGLPQAPDMRFEIKDGKAAVTHSGCPDKTCVRTGFISRPGQAAVCLPNKVVLSIEGAAPGPGSPDMVAG